MTYHPHGDVLYPCIAQQLLGQEPADGHSMLQLVAQQHEPPEPVLQIFCTTVSSCY